MSNSSNPNGINGNSNPLGTRDGTRVVLREITATLQNSPPIQIGPRKVANNTQPGKTEHEVKVQFTREFVDAGAPNSRPESLSSASSFQSLASTLSSKSSSLPPTTPVTPLRAADTSYVNSNISGLEDLITACGNINLNDKVDADKTETFNSLIDTTIAVTVTENPFQLANNVQNSSHEEAFTSAINDSSHLNGTQDLSSDYKEACETSNSFDNTRESALDLKLDESNFEPAKDLSYEETAENLTEVHINHSSDIPQTFINNSAAEESRDSSLKPEACDPVNFNTTVDVIKTLEQVERISPSAEDHFVTSCSSQDSQPLNQSHELTATCNSTLNNLESRNSEVSNLTDSISNGDDNQSIGPKSQSIADVTVNLSSEFSVTEADKDISTLNDPLNLPPELDVLDTTRNISTINVQSLGIPNGAGVEISTVEEPQKKESISFVETHVEPESIQDFNKELEATDQTSQVSEKKSAVDISTDHFTNVLISGNTNETETPISSIIAEIPKNLSAEILQETTAEEAVQQISNNHSIPTVVQVSEGETKVTENLEPLGSSRIEEIQETAKPILPEILNQKNSELEFEQSKELSTEIPAKELSQIDEKKTDSLEVLPPVEEKIVPYDTQDLPTSVKKFEESKSEELPQEVINVTPFPGSNLENQRESAIDVEECSQDKDSSNEQDSNQTVIIKEDSFQSVGSDGISENYQAFLPQQQSTRLQSDCNFKTLEQAAQVIAEEIRNKSLEFTEDSDQFFNADSELFADPASFDFFLSKSNCKNTIRDLRAESLYVKFDPLVGNANMLPQGPPQVVDGEENTKASIPQPTLDTPKRNPAVAAIDRLLIYSPSAGTPHKVEEPPKIEEKIVEEVKPEIVPIIDETMAKELELVRSTVLQLDAQLEKERKEHEEELEKQRLSYKKLKDEVALEVQKKNEMTMVMDEYEKSLSRQMADRERERASFAQERAKLQEDLQAANHHLGNTEAAFNDVHSKYERLKIVVSAYKSNEDVLKESVQENVETIKTLEARYEQLKNHAMSQLEKANLELEAIRKQHETETVRLQAMIRKAELKSNSLAEMVEQKSKENKELAAILDEVIARVGHNSE